MTQPPAAGWHPPVGMTLDQVDRALADWRTRLQRIDDNLMALETSPVCMLLEQAQEGGLEGATRARVAPALAAMRELFARRGLLDEVLAKASEIRRGLNRIWPGDGLKDIEQLLRGPSITLPPVETPLARRGLLDAAQTTSAIAPDQLVTAMVASFEEARDAVAAVDQAWNQLTPEVTRAAAEADRLQALAHTLGHDATTPLAAVRAQIDAVRVRIARDPLGATDALTQGVASRLEGLGAQLGALQARHDQAETDMARAHVVLAEIRTTHERAVAADRRCAGEIEEAPQTPPRPAPVDVGRLTGLAQWLTTLDTTLAQGRWPAAGVGVTRWLTAAQQILADEQAAEQAGCALLDRREELLGRLLARRQQALALAARGRALDPELETLGRRAESLLRAVPTPLARAAALVSDYEERLRATTG